MRRMMVAGLMLVSLSAFAQSSQTRVRGNTEIEVKTGSMTAVAAGEGNVAKNRVGVVKADKSGDTKIQVTTGNVTTIAKGRNRKACTNIGGIVKDECK